jgi:phosphoglycerate dehydrogenase-like enzyme
MSVSVANRSPVSASDVVDRTYALTELPGLMGSVDAVVNTLPLTDETRGLIGAAELAAMRPDAVILNVGRGGVIDEAALYDALKAERIGGAIIDTWYVYPNTENANPLPAHLPFHELGNVTMTPHMSGWTHGTIHRRRATIADNINLCASGKELKNRIR